MLLHSGCGSHVVTMEEEVHIDDNWPSDDEEDVNWDWEDETSKYYTCLLFICYNEYDIMLGLLVNHEYLGQICNQWHIILLYYKSTSFFSYN